MLNELWFKASGAGMQSHRGILVAVHGDNRMTGLNTNEYIQ